MSVLKNPQHEKYAQLIAKGTDADLAYRKVFPRAGAPSAKSLASRLSNADHVSQRIFELQQASATATVLTMQERREFLARVVRAKLNEIDLKLDGDLIQEITDTITETSSTRKIKLPGKRECVMDDAKLAGDLSDKLTVNHRGTIEHQHTNVHYFPAVMASPRLPMPDRQPLPLTVESVPAKVKRAKAREVKPAKMTK